MPALWITASKRPSLLTSLATVVAPAMVERSPQTAPWAPTAARRASRLRPSFRPCRTTSWPCSIRSLAANRPRPSDDPVMNTRAIAAPPLSSGTIRVTPRFAGNHLTLDPTTLRAHCPAPDDLPEFREAVGQGGGPGLQDQRRFDLVHVLVL